MTESKKIINKIMIMLGKIVIYLVSDRIICKVIWWHSIQEFYPNQTTINLTGLFIILLTYFLDPIVN